MKWNSPDVGVEINQFQDETIKRHVTKCEIRCIAVETRASTHQCFIYKQNKRVTCLASQQIYITLVYDVTL